MLSSVLCFDPLFKPASRLPFIVKGSHNTITAYTLPNWLPDNVIDSMNSHFGALLRKELTDFITRSELQRTRVGSTGSRATSVHSLEDDPYDLVSMTFH
jgi:hypothetical protein